MSADTASLNAENKAVEELKGIKRSSEDVANEADALKKAKSGAAEATDGDATHANGNAEKPVVNGVEHATDNGAVAEAKAATNGVEGVKPTEDDAVAAAAAEEEDLEDEDEDEDEDCEDEDEDDDEDDDEDEEDGGEEDDDEEAAVDGQES